jgi:hypothetical protein
VKALALVVLLDDTLQIENDAVAPARSKVWPRSTASQQERNMYKDEISTAATTDIMMLKLNADSFEHYQQCYYTDRGAPAREAGATAKQNWHGRTNYCQMKNHVSRHKRRKITDRRFLLRKNGKPGRTAYL